MNISISSWHNSSFDSKKIKFFTLFHFLSRLLTSNHFNQISKYLVGRNGVMWKTCFSASQNAKNESQPKHKNQVRNRHLLTVRSSSMKDYTCHYVGITEKTNVYINFNTIYVNFEIFCLHVTGYSNTNVSFLSCMFVEMASGKCEPHTHFTFLQRILTSTHMKIFNIFCIIYVAMSKIHFSRLDKY